MRSKTEYVVKTIEGKSVPQKLGMAPIQRADVEYEFDIYADMDADNTMIIQKSRCRALSGQIIPKPDADLAEVIRTWLAGAPVVQAETTKPAPVNQKADTAEPLAPPLDEQIKQAKLRAQKLGLACDSAEWTNFLAQCKVTILKSAVDLEKVIERMDQFEREQEARVKPAKPQSETPQTSVTSPNVPASTGEKQAASKDETKTGLDQEVRDKLNDLYVRAKKLGLCTNEKQFVGYIRRVVNNPQLDIKYVTLATLEKVEGDIVTKEKADQPKSA